MEKIPALSEEDYLQIEDALCTNARGRAFLRMRDRRARLIASDEAKALMRRLANSVKKGPAVAEPPGAGIQLRILRQELQEMSVYIQQTRNEIAALRPDDNGNNRIMAATGELDAIVSATERATSDILNAAENIQALLPPLSGNPETSPAAQQIEAQLTEIMTACSFQDITGQRTTKVVNTLRYLEKRVNSMIEIWGNDDLRQVNFKEDGDERPDAHLLNGPTEEGVSQADVDALLAELNTASTHEPKPIPAGIEIAPPKASAVKAETRNGHAPASQTADINQSDIDALFD